MHHRQGRQRFYRFSSASLCTVTDIPASGTELTEYEGKDLNYTELRPGADLVILGPVAN